MAAENHGERDDDRGTTRLEAFSDGVIAVAITLLILNFKIPSVTLDDPGFWAMMLSQWPTQLAFATSFFTVGIIWLNHHRLFKHIKYTDMGLLSLNLLLLFIIVFVPVPTALVSEYFLHPNQHAAAILYSGTFLAMACCVNVLWRYASYHGRLLSKDADSHAVLAISQRYRFGPLLYLITFGVAWINTPVSVVLNLLLALLFAPPGRLPRPPEQKQ
jgi:uncharacterized membrane protein